MERRLGVKEGKGDVVGSSTLKCVEGQECPRQGDRGLFLSETLPLGCQLPQSTLFPPLGATQLRAPQREVLMAPGNFSLTSFPQPSTLCCVFSFWLFFFSSLLTMTWSLGETKRVSSLHMHSLPTSSHVLAPPWVLPEESRTPSPAGAKGQQQPGKAAQVLVPSAPTSRVPAAWCPPPPSSSDFQLRFDRLPGSPKCQLQR